MGYWITFALICVAFVYECIVYLRNKQLDKRRVVRELQRNINRYSA